jgi:hypothetical protein
MSDTLTRASLLSNSTQKLRTADERGQLKIAIKLAVKGSRPSSYQ